MGTDHRHVHLNMGTPGTGKMNMNPMWVDEVLNRARPLCFMVGRELGRTGSVIPSS